MNIEMKGEKKDNTYSSIEQGIATIISDVEPGGAIVRYTDEYFVNKLNESLETIRKNHDSNTKQESFVSINMDDYLYSNSPVLSNNNSDNEDDEDEVDCFEDSHEFSTKCHYKKLTFNTVKRSLDKYYECEENFSNELDILITYLNGQKNLYIQAKNLTQLKLNLLMFPSLIGTGAISLFAPFIQQYSWSGGLIAGLNAMVTICLSIIHYLKLESAVETFLQLSTQYDKLENSLQMSSSKLFFMEGAQEKSEFLLEKMEDFEAKMNDIKDMTNVLIPEEIKRIFPIIYHVNIFSFIKRMETYKIKLIVKFKDVKNEIQYILCKYGDEIRMNENHRMKKRLEFICDVKEKIKEELLYYRNAYGCMDELFIREIKQSENIPFWKYYCTKKKKPDNLICKGNPVIEQYLSVIFSED
jgi:hypothetical protein